MKDVFVNQDHVRVGYYKSVLDEAGIASFVRNESTNNPLAKMPAPLFFPVLCVINDDDYDRAMEILGAIHNAPPSEATVWNCPKCNEEVPGNFDSCWKCGEVRLAEC